MTGPGGSAPSMVSFPSDGISVPAFLARPAGPGHFPGVLIVHEIWGLDEHMRDVAGRFAREGFVALVPDLLHRRGGLARFCVANAFRGLVTDPTPGQPAHRDLRAGMAYLRSLPEVDALRTGAVGFCMGGGFSLLLACTERETRACVVFYGRPPQPIDVVANLQCPLRGFYGERDRFFTRRLPSLRAALDRHGKQYEIEVYPEAAHAFFNDTSRNYRPQVAADAWVKALAYLREQLGTPTGGL